MARGGDTAERPDAVGSAGAPPALCRTGQPVLDLLIDRIEAGSRVGERADRARLALVIEGGGMRGVVAGGMGSALHQLGAEHAFDAVYGTSAGVFCGAYFLAGQPTLGTSIYYRHLIGEEFISWRRALRGGPLVNVDYLIDVAMERLKPLDYDRVLASPTPLKVLATRLGSYEAVAFGGFETKHELREAMRASCRIPLASGPPVLIAGHRYLDGSLSQSIPVASALADGATHVLALLTRPAGQRRSEPALWERRLLHPVMNRMENGLGDAHRPNATAYGREMDVLEAMSAAGTPPFAAVLALPATAGRVGQLERSAERLFDAAAAGARLTYAALTGIAPESAESLLAPRVVSDPVG
jgi:predicted patatin/cPLA2 family phospholipase